MKRTVMSYTSPALTTEIIVFYITHLVMMLCIIGILYFIWKDRPEPKNKLSLLLINLLEKFKQRVKLIPAYSLNLWFIAIKIVHILFR